MTRHITDIERLKKLEPVMERCGVQPVDYLIYAKHPVLPCWVLESKASKTDIYFWNGEDKLGLFDYAALESVLPDWWFDYHNEGSITVNISMSDSVSFSEAQKIGVEAFRFRNQMSWTRGSEKLNAMCDLILLLDENNIELRRCESE